MKINSHYIITENIYDKMLRAKINDPINKDFIKGNELLKNTSNLTGINIKDVNVYDGYQSETNDLEFILHGKNNEIKEFKGRFKFYFLYDELYIFKGTSNTPINIIFEKKNISILNAKQKYKIKSIDLKTYSWYDDDDDINEIDFIYFELKKPNRIKKSLKKGTISTGTTTTQQTTGTATTQQTTGTATTQQTTSTATTQQTTSTASFFKFNNNCDIDIKISYNNIVYKFKEKALFEKKDENNYIYSILLKKVFLEFELDRKIDFNEQNEKYKIINGIYIKHTDKNKKIRFSNNSFITINSIKINKP